MEKELAKFFAYCWDCFLKDGLDEADLEAALNHSKLAEWTDATQEHVDRSEGGFEVGDPILVLTKEGRNAIKSTKNK